MIGDRVADALARRGRRDGDGAALRVDHMYVQDRTDVELVASAVAPPVRVRITALTSGTGPGAGA